MMTLRQNASHSQYIELNHKKQKGMAATAADTTWLSHETEAEIKTADYRDKEPRLSRK